MSTIRPFHFSAVIETPQSRQEWIARARRAEDLGYTTILVPDHLKLIDPAVGLMLAADTTSLRIGSHVFCNDFRHPVSLARQAANLDLFSDGRFQFGLGCGYLFEEYEQAGILLDPANIRVGRFEEALQIIKMYFQEETVNFSGRYYQVKALPASIKTVQKPHPPIYVGGGSKRILSIAAREADIVGLTARSTNNGVDWTSALTEANQAKMGWIRQAAGQRFEQLSFSNTIFIAAVTDYARPAAQQIGSHIGLTAEQALDCAHILIGSVEQIVEELQRRRELFGISLIEVAEPHMDILGPVIARLAGR
jgi:probable F420-dependent oxidoreductase